MKKTASVILFLLVMAAGVRAQSSAYKMAGPYEIVARDGQYRNTKAGSERDMKAALDFAEAGKADEALAIINAYAGTLQRLDGHDAPLCLIQGYDLVRAMTRLSAHKTTAWDEMLRRAFLPAIRRFDADSPYANGNWGAIVNRMRMAMAIEMGDSVLYRESVDYFLHANDNGSLPRYISQTGQCQETGRDQGHVQLGLEALAQTCEMAYQVSQSPMLCEKLGEAARTDLWGALDNRMLKGFEYTARYNLGHDVPFTTWTDCTGLYNDWTEPDAMNRGKLWDIYQLPYDHFVGRKGLKMPYTRQAIKVLGSEKLKARNEKLSRQKEHHVFTWPAPQGAPLMHDYEVYVQPRGGKEWTRIDTYNARVNSWVTGEEAPANGTAHRVSDISYAFFDFTGDVFVKVVSRKRKFQTARIRPDYRGVIANVQNDSTVQFLLFQPENVSVELDGDIRHNLLLFTSKPVQSADEARREAEKKGRRFVYVAPGLYEDLSAIQGLMPEDDGSVKPHAVDVTESSAPVSKAVVRVPSRTTVYLAPGSFVKGTFAIEDASEVSILGRGICRPSDGYEGAHVHRSDHVLIDGIILNTCPVGASHDVVIHDVRSISHPSWGDGLNVFGGCRNILYDRVFCRNSDDCSTVYATRKGFHGSVSGVTMRNSTLWADLAHPVMIGIHGNATESEHLASHPELGDSITDIRYENIDILGQAERQVDYQGCLAINCGDNNYISNVVFDNIRIEAIESGSLVHVKTVRNEKYCAAAGRVVKDVTFRNIRYGSLSHPAPIPGFSLLTGYDEARPVQDIRFESLKINGQLIYDDMPSKAKWYRTSDFSGFYVNEHVRGLEFVK